MSHEEEVSTHRQRHLILHEMFDELLADYLQNARGSRRTSIHDSLFLVMQWSYKQKETPDHSLELHYSTKTNRDILLNRGTTKHPGQ